MKSAKNFLTVETVITAGETCVYGCDVKTQTLSSQRVPETSPRPNKHGKFTLKAKPFESVEKSQEISLAELRAFLQKAFYKGCQNWGEGSGWSSVLGV